MVIRLLDHLQHCSTYDDGQIIFEMIAPKVEAGEDVVLSFDGVSAVPSAFVNAALLRLVERVSIDEVRRHLSIVDSTRQINDMIRSRFGFVQAQAGNAA
ncbi:STAS-like domain-containing protein [Variovorax paradoxus]|uniref:DUF4325 domain-containing protein n=1 Tax=Variovorax paradoxus (strain EPS) TaxID=595537 RepID=E6V3S9_VARPE|nr:STAS-like domain-containing protein [Variovorax paradoxus]ADU36953.1 hypothetical protein Varpa_2755 [Variovorax paradoxus EPS]